MRTWDQLIEKMEYFIAKYYKNQMVKGGILFVSVLLLSYGFVTGLEYIGRFNGNIRLLLLATFIGVNTFLLGRFLVIPLLKLKKVGRHLTLKEAAVMIGAIFPEVGDKLSNALQFHEEKNNPQFNLDLVQASIEQRAVQLSVIPFASAIDLRENRKYLRFLLPIATTLALVGVLYPDWFISGSDRIVHFNTTYIAPAPFEFVLESSGSVVQGEDYTLQIRLVGDEIPSEVTIQSNKGTYNLERASAVSFEHTFSHLSDELEFVCVANEYTSAPFKVNVLHPPVLEEISLKATFPPHTGMSAATFEHTGAITVPEGTLIQWDVHVDRLKHMDVLFEDTTIRIPKSPSNHYLFDKRVYQTAAYGLALSSEEVENADSLGYTMVVIKDQYPAISIVETVDSVDQSKRFIEGKITDDYGFRSLSASLSITRKDTAYTLLKPLVIQPQTTTQRFSYEIDLSLLDLGPGDKLTYSFSVTDNDAVNGYKSVVSRQAVVVVPEMDELDNQLSEQSDQLEEGMRQALNDSKELKEKMRSLKKNLLNQSSPSWKDKRHLEDIMDLKKQLETAVQDLQKKVEKHKNDREDFLETENDLSEKQDKLQELMESLMDEELKELFEQLEELSEEMNKEEWLKKLESVEQKTESMEDKLDRTLELFKNMELDQKLNQLETQLTDLKKQQDELIQKVDSTSVSTEELEQEQKQIADKFDEIEKDIQQVKEKNDQLERSRDLNFNDELKENIRQELGDAKEKLQNNKRKKSKKSQQKAAEMMQQMADEVAQMQSQSQRQRQQEDMEALRHLLENIVALSHDQEDLMDDYRITKSVDPHYLTLNRKQIQVDRSTAIVSDSLTALSKRVHELSTFITDNLSSLNGHLDQALQLSEERNTKQLLLHQHYAMTDYNDLALMLSEVLDQMQQQAQSAMEGAGQGAQSGGEGKGNAKGEMSVEQMKEAMKRQIERMKKGKSPGGKEGITLPGLSAKERAQMAVQQARMREALKKMRGEMNKDGSGSGNQLNDLINDLDQLEKDLVNSKADQNYLQRQQDILTRLLESEKALRERGYSEERASSEGKNKSQSNLIPFTEYKRKKEAEIELLRSLPIGLQVYYKNLINEYFNAVNN